MSKVNGHRIGRIAFASAREGDDMDIYVMAGQRCRAADGQRVFRLGMVTTAVGRFLREDSEIYVMNADGSGVVQLTDNEYYDSFPAWLPVVD